MTQAEHPQTVEGRPTRYALAKALLDSGLIARYQDALRAHPATMHSEEPEEIALGWAGDILAVLEATR